MKLRVLSPVLLLVIIVVCVAFTMYKTGELKEFEKNSKVVFVSKEDIPSGTMLVEKMIKRRRIANDKVKDSVVVKLEDALGATTTRDIKSGEQICSQDLGGVQTSGDLENKEQTKDKADKEESDSVPQSNQETK